MNKYGYFSKFPLLLLYLLISINVIALANNPQVKGSQLSDKRLRVKDKSYLDKQAEIFLDTIQSILAYNPPSIIESKERGFANLLMDAVFQEEKSTFRKPSQEFFHARVSKVIRELENTMLKKGARIWKLYNMGFIIRTESVTLAFDFASGITTGCDDFAMNQDEIERIVEQCDALFISHRHEENGEKRIAEQFIKKRLPVFAPEEIWETDKIQRKIINPERIAHKSQQFKVNDKKIDVVTYPGHQMDGVECNVYLITTPEGITMSHLGDQVNEGDFTVDYEWIDKVKENYEVHIMMPNACTKDISRIVEGFNPKLVLPSHELEHAKWKELAFWADDKYLEWNYAELKASNYPVIKMLWGESFYFSPDYFIKKRPFLELSNWY